MALVNLKLNQSLGFVAKRFLRRGQITVATDEMLARVLAIKKETCGPRRILGATRFPRRPCSPK